MNSALQVSKPVPFFIQDRVVMSAIVINTIVLFVLSFDSIKTAFPLLEYADSFFTVYFFVEMLIKIRLSGWKNYISSGWHKLDFFVVVVTLPSVLLLFFEIPDFSLLLILRALRIVKFFRFLEFFPNVSSIINGVARAIKASVFVLIAFFIYNVIISLFTCYLFKDQSPEHFGNALLSFYSIFKMFTLEGWYEIPESIARNTSVELSFFIKFYFIFLVITGGVFGLSIVNAIFVDEMVADNNDEMLSRINQLENKIDQLLLIIEEKKAAELLENDTDSTSK